MRDKTIWLPCQFCVVPSTHEVITDHVPSVGWAVTPANWSTLQGYPSILFWPSYFNFFPANVEKTECVLHSITDRETAGLTLWVTPLNVQESLFTNYYLHTEWFSWHILISIQSLMFQRQFSAQSLILRLIVPALTDAQKCKFWQAG